jgi:hypothetical protein
MVWMNNEHYNAKSYPREAYGGAICNCVRCTKARKDRTIIDEEKARIRGALKNALVDNGKRAGGSWQDGIANDLYNPL